MQAPAFSTCVDYVSAPWHQKRHYHSSCAGYGNVKTGFNATCCISAVTTPTTANSLETCCCRANLRDPTSWAHCIVSARHVAVCWKKHHHSYFVHAMLIWHVMSSRDCGQNLENGPSHWLLQWHRISSWNRRRPNNNKYVYSPCCWSIKGQMCNGCHRHISKTKQSR